MEGAGSCRALNQAHDGIAALSLAVLVVRHPTAGGGLPHSCVQVLPQHWLPVVHVQVPSRSTGACWPSPTHHSHPMPSSFARTVPAKGAKDKGQSLEDLEREQGGPVLESKVAMAQHKRATLRRQDVKGARAPCCAVLCIGWRRSRRAERGLKSTRGAA